MALGHVSIEESSQRIEFAILKGQLVNDSLFLLARPSQDVFVLSPLISLIEQGGSVANVLICYSMTYTLRHHRFKFNVRSGE